MEEVTPSRVSFLRDKALHLQLQSSSDSGLRQNKKGERKMDCSVDK